MTVAVHVILLVAAVVLLVLAAVGVGHPRFNLLAAGLACWPVATQFIP